MLKTLLHTRARIFFSFMRNKKAVGYRNRVLRPLLILFLPWWVFQASYTLFSNWQFLPGYHLNMVLNYTALSITGLFFLMIVSGIPLALHYHFLSHDLPLLFSLPIKTPTVFLFKLYEQTLTNSTIFGLIGLPVLLSAFFVLNLNILYLIPFLIFILLFLLIPSGLASLLSASIAFVLPVKRSRQAASVVLGLLVVGLWTLLQFFNTDKLDPYSGEFDRDLFNRFFADNTIYEKTMLPSVWLILLLKAFVMNHTQNILLYGGILLITAVILFKAAIYLLQFAYNKDIHVRALKSFSGKPAKKTQKNTGPVRIQHILSSLVRRDFLLVIRDSRFVTQFFFYMAIVIVFSIAFQLPTENSNETLALYQPFTLLVIAVSIMAGGIVSRSIALEKKAFLNNIINPLPVKILLHSKKIIPLVSTLVAAGTGFLTICVYTRPSLLVIVQVVTILIAHTLAITGIGLWIGTRYTKLLWENPRMMLGETGGFVLNFSIILYTIIILALGYILLNVNPWLALIILSFISITAFIITSGLSEKQLIKLTD